MYAINATVKDLLQEVRNNHPNEFVSEIRRVDDELLFNLECAVVLVKERRALEMDHEILTAVRSVAETGATIEELLSVGVRPSKENGC